MVPHLGAGLVNVRSIAKTLISEALFLMSTTSIPPQFPTLLLWGITNHHKADRNCRIAHLKCLKAYLSSDVECFMTSLVRSFNSFPNLRYPNLMIPHTRRVNMSYEHHKLYCYLQIDSLLDAGNSGADEKSRDATLFNINNISSEEEFALLCRWNRVVTFGKDAPLLSFIGKTLQDELNSLLQSYSTVNLYQISMDTMVSSLEILRVFVQYCKDKNVAIFKNVVKPYWIQLSKAYELRKSDKLTDLLEKLLVLVYHVVLDLYTYSGNHNIHIITEELMLNKILLCSFFRKLNSEDNLPLININNPLVVVHFLQVFNSLYSQYLLRAPDDNFSCIFTAGEYLIDGRWLKYNSIYNFIQFYQNCKWEHGELSQIQNEISDFLSADLHCVHQMITEFHEFQNQAAVDGVMQRLSNCLRCVWQTLGNVSQKDIDQIHSPTDDFTSIYSSTKLLKMLLRFVAHSNSNSNNTENVSSNFLQLFLNNCMQITNNLTFADNHVKFEEPLIDSIAIFLQHCSIDRTELYLSVEIFCVQIKEKLDAIAASINENCLSTYEQLKIIQSNGNGSTCKVLSMLLLEFEALLLQFTWSQETPATLKFRTYVCDIWMEKFSTSQSIVPGIYESLWEFPSNKAGIVVWKKSLLQQYISLGTFFKIISTVTSCNDSPNVLKENIVQLIPQIINLLQSNCASLQKDLCKSLIHSMISYIFQTKYATQNRNSAHTKYILTKQLFDSLTCDIDAILDDKLSSLSPTSFNVIPFENVQLSILPYELLFTLKSAKEFQLWFKILSFFETHPSFQLFQRSSVPMLRIITLSKLATTEHMFRWHQQQQSGNDQLSESNKSFSNELGGILFPWLVLLSQQQYRLCHTSQKYSMLTLDELKGFINIKYYRSTTGKKEWNYFVGKKDDIGDTTKVSKILHSSASGMPDLVTHFESQIMDGFFNQLLSYDIHAYMILLFSLGTYFPYRFRGKILQDLQQAKLLSSLDSDMLFHDPYTFCQVILMSLGNVFAYNEEMNEFQWIPSLVIGLVDYHGKLDAIEEYLMYQQIVLLLCDHPDGRTVDVSGTMVQLFITTVACYFIRNTIEGPNNTYQCCGYGGRLFAELISANALSIYENVCVHDKILRNIVLKYLLLVNIAQSKTHSFTLEQMKEMTCHIPVAESTPLIDLIYIFVNKGPLANERKEWTLRELLNEFSSQVVIT